MRAKLQYQQSQDRLASSVWFRYFWEFWAIYSFVFFIAAFVYILSKSNRVIVFVLAVVAFFVARGVLVTVINLFYKRERPYQKFNFAPITSKFFSFRTHRPNSFPSRHTIAYMSVSAVVLMYFPWLGVGLIVVSLMAGVGRVILGYHWPSDIIAGIILGVLVGYLTVFLGSALLFT